MPLRIENAIDRLNEVIVDIRAYIFDLQQERVDGNFLLDLAATVQEFRENSALRVIVLLPRCLTGLRDDRASAMIHITREALSNACKHAKASEVRITIRALDEMVDMEICDDGVGFDQSVALATTHHGLRNMRQRTRHLGGSFDVECEARAGTALHVTMPMGH